MRASRAATVSVRAAKVSVKAAPKAKVLVKQNNLTVLAKLADLGLLSKVEELKVLSQVEKAGLLSYAENNGLLSFAEKSGLIKAAADSSTPGTLSIIGFLLLVAAAATGSQLDGTADIAAIVLGVTGVAAIAGSSALSTAQNL
ncbi:hypothetical protein FOA52_009279 [Chlamydomonas sp. UWO 241]|nr:hypothetical protein FOA52_009279 [Chlamydomonas sp. UWO 241]